MSKRSAQKKISQMQLYPLAFNPAGSPSSWVSLKYGQSSLNNVDYLVVQKPKIKMTCQQICFKLSQHAIMWNAFITFIIVIGYFLTSTIYIYLLPKSPFDFWFYIILVCDLIYIVDVILSVCSRVTASLQTNILEKPKSISLIVLDLVLSLPYSTIYLLVNWKITLAFLILRLMTLIRIYRLVLFFISVEKSIQRHRWAIFCVKFVSYFLVAIHFFACVWYILSTFPGKNGTWIGGISDTIRLPKTEGEWYLLTSYFSVTHLTQTGFGDFYPVSLTERIIGGVTIGAGVLIWSYYISCLIILFLRRKYLKYKIQRQLSLVLQHLTLTKAEKTLHRKCIKYFEVFWVRRRGILTADETEDLPGMVSVHMSQKCCSAALKCSMIFNDKPASFLRKMCLYLRQEFYLPGQDIFTEYKMKEKMIIIRSGTVDILSEEDNESPIISLSPGTCLAEISLILSLPSKVNVRAVTFVETHAIYTRDFCKIISTYPDFYMDIRQSIYKRITKKMVNTSKTRTNWKDLKKLLGESENLINISTPITTRYLPLYKMAPSSRNLKLLRQNNKYLWIRKHDTISMLLWEIFILTCAVSVAFFYPYFIAFHRSFPPWYENISNAIHIIYVFDLYVLLTTSIVKKGQKINTIHGILDERMDSFSFYMDVFACFYLEVYAPFTYDEDRFYYLLKLNRLLKIARISTFCDRFEKPLTNKAIRISCLKHLIFITLFSYWFSLLLYTQTCFYQSCVYDGWFLNKLRESVSYGHLGRYVNGRFLISIYYGLSNALVVAFGDISPVNRNDLILSVVGVVTGKIVLGYCIAELSSILTLSLKSENKFEEIKTAVRFYASKRSIPRKLERRIKNYLDIQWTYNGAHAIVAEKSPLSNLPKCLRHEILAHEKLVTLRKFVVFDEMDEKFLSYLVENAKTLVIGPNEIVTYFGSINREMYFIYKGWCLKQTDTNAYETIGPGSAIGFSSLLFGLPSLNNICTVTHSVLFHINVETFNKALRSTPQLYKTVYRTRQLILAKYQSTYEVKMIENPHYTKRKKKLKLKCKKLNEKMGKHKSFVNAYKYCVANKESYSKLSNTAGKICFLKYLLMPISILPNGTFLRIWYSIRLSVTLILYFTLPMEYLLSSYRSEVHYFRFVLEMVVYIDMYLRFHVTYYGNKNQLIIHPWTTAKHYLNGQFLLDILIWFPSAAVLLLINSNHNEGHSEFAHTISPHLFHCSVHLIKILDIYRVITALKYIGRKWNQNWFFRHFKYVFLTILLSHIWTMILMSTTCKYIHYQDIPSKYVFGNVTRIPDMLPMVTAELNLYCQEHSWLNRSSQRSYSTAFQVYLTASHFVLQSMTGLGLGDVHAENKAEMIIVILIFLTGVVFFGYLLTDIISRSTRPNYTLLVQESKFLHLVSFMEMEKIDRFLSKKIREYLQYKWSRIRNLNLHSLLSKLNPSLHEDAVLFLYENTLKHVPMFESLDHSFFRVIGKEMKEEYFMEGDIIVQINDIVSDIYVIHKGSVEVSSPHNMIPVIMGVGGVFGNVFTKDISLCGITVRAVRNVDILCLRVETFRQILKDYPYIQKKLSTLTRSETHKYYAIPNSVVDDGNVYLNPNTHWTTRRQKNKKMSFVSACKNSLSPDSHKYNAFSCFLLLTGYCNCVLTTYQFCFQHFSNLLLIAAILIDVVFLLKFCIEINAPRVTSPGFITNRSFLAKCMQRKWRRTSDFLSNLPLSYTLLFIPFISHANANFYFSLWRLLTLLRFYHMIQFFFIHKEKLMFRRILLEMGSLLVFSTMICHLLACLWYLIICPWRTCTDFSWIPNSTEAISSPTNMYVVSVYLIINILSCTGTGEIAPKTTSQMLMVVIYMILSKILLGYFIIQLIRILQCGNVWLIKYETVIRQLSSYYTNMGGQKTQINFLVRYMSKLWRKKNGLQTYELVTELPRSLRIDLMVFVYGKLIKDSYIFCRTEKDFMRQLSLQLKHRTYFPGDYIVRDGDVDSCMYFIHRGGVQILTLSQTGNDTVHEVLHEKEVFGIVQGLFKEIPHHFSFRALTIVDIAVLKLGEWEYLLEFFPKSKDVIYQRVEEIYYTL